MNKNATDTAMPWAMYALPYPYILLLHCVVIDIKNIVY